MVSRETCPLGRFLPAHRCGAPIPLLRNCALSEAGTLSRELMSGAIRNHMGFAEFIRRMTGASPGKGNNYALALSEKYGTMLGRIIRLIT